MAEEGVAGLKESKFASLLVPIRDLAGNWGIDIANDLEEYLAHLNRTAFSFDGGPSLDFAEAALLIQSSACVYSKKVEYLHNLAYQALETVRSRKRPGEGAEGPEGPQEGGPAQRSKGGDREDDDTLEAFLSAGDELKEADEKDLNLAREEDEAGATGYVRAPAALLALEDQGGGGGDGDAGFYRLAQCHVHISGALFLDAMEADAYDAHLNSSGTGGVQAELHAAMQQQMGAGAQSLGAAQGAGDDDDDGDDGGPGFGGADDEDEEGAQAQPAAADPHAADQQQQQQEQQAAASAGAAALATAAQAFGGPVGVSQPLPSVPGEEDGVQEEVYDPYKPLDMHSKGSLPIKPMQVRRPPRGRQLKPVVFAARKPNAADPAARAAAAAGLAYPEFAYGLQLLPGQGKAKPRAQGAQQQQYLGRSVLDAGEAEAAAQALQGGGEEAPGADPAAAGLEEADAGAGWQDADDGVGDDAGPLGGPDDDDGGGGFDALDLMHDIRGAGAWGEGGGAYAEGREEAGPSSYEDLCRAHIEAMVNAAAAQEVQSELAQRVSGWRTKIDPVLKDEEGRSNFDIQAYSERIIKRLQEAAQPSAADKSSNKDPMAGFDAVAKDGVSYEVSRTFAAMLQLINNRNIELVREGDDPDAHFRLHLLMEQLPHKRMAETLQGNIAEGQELASLQPSFNEADESAAATKATAASKRPPKKRAKNVAAPS